MLIRTGTRASAGAAAAQAVCGASAFSTQPMTLHLPQAGQVMLGEPPTVKRGPSACQAPAGLGGWGHRPATPERSAGETSSQSKTRAFSPAAREPSGKCSIEHVPRMLVCEGVSPARSGGWRGGSKPWRTLVRSSAARVQRGK